MRQPRVRFTLGRMMIAVAVVGIECGFITMVARGISDEGTARAWLVSTILVSGFQFLFFLLIICVRLYIKTSHIIDVIMYKGPLKHK